MSIGYVVISVCATMPDRTCAERFMVAPIDYGLLVFPIHLSEITKLLIFFRKLRCISKAFI